MIRLQDTAIRPEPDFERLRTVLTRDGIPDRVPFYELFVNQPVMEAVLGKPVVTVEDTIEFYYKAGYDYVPVWPNVDFVYGSLVDRSLGYPIHGWDDVDKYPWPDPGSVKFLNFEAAAPILPDGMKMIGQTGGVFEAAEGLLGYEQLCYLLADDPEFVQEIFKRIGCVYEVMYAGMAAIPEVGAVVISDDLGFKTQTLIGVEDLRKYVFPVHKRLCEIIHDAGKCCILHSCGNLSEVMDDIIDYVGIDAKHSYEDSILPVEDAKKLYGDRIAILGGFDLDRLCRSDEKTVREYTRSLIETCGSTGGYALGSGNSIAAYVPVENYLAMLDEGWKSS